MLVVRFDSTLLASYHLSACRITLFLCHLDPQDICYNLYDMDLTCVSVTICSILSV